MWQGAILLASASFARTRAKAFSVNEDLLAFPQYEVVFSDSYILDSDAESSLIFASSHASAQAKATSAITASPSTTSGELSTLKHDAGDTSSRIADNYLLEKPETYEYMMLNSSPYLCALPLANAAARNRTDAAQSQEDEAKELARATDKGWELLKELEGNCMYFASGWWSYSFCYNREVKQFHALPAGRGGVPVYPPMEDDTVPSFVLGQFVEPKATKPKQVDAPPPSKDAPAKGGKDSTDLAQIQTKGDMRYMVQKLYGGSTCDITGRSRKIEVQFHCHPQSGDRIGWIKETSTCAYLMVIYTPRLCNDVAFQPPKENDAQQIVCREIIRPDELDAWRAKKAAETERKLVGSKGESTGTASSRPVVGGIELGGMKTVGSDGKRIDAPKVFHPMEQSGEIVARWSPNENEGKVQQMTNDQLRELDLTPAVVEEMRARLHELANNRPWKLEVREKPGGDRELMGIVEDDDEGDELDWAVPSGKQEEGKETKENKDGKSSENGDEEGSEETLKDTLSDEL